MKGTKVLQLQHNLKDKCECDESRKNVKPKIWRNPKFYLQGLYSSEITFYISSNT